MESSPKVIQFTRLKQWYIPLDADSYLTLKKIGIPLTKIHENFIPTLRLITQNHNIQGKLVDFNKTILDPYLDNMGSIWNKKSNRKATISNSLIKLEATDPAAPEDKAKQKALFEKVEASLRKFFSRWGFQGVFEYSEARGKSKLHVSYKFDSTKTPIIPLTEDVQENSNIVLDIGFTRIALFPTDKDIELKVSVAAGSGWKVVHSGKTTYSQISDIRPMLTALMDILNKDPNNFENKAKT